MRPPLRRESEFEDIDEPDLGICRVSRLVPGVSERVAYAFEVIDDALDIDHPCAHDARALVAEVLTNVLRAPPSREVTLRVMCTPTWARVELDDRNSAVSVDTHARLLRYGLDVEPGVLDDMALDWGIVNYKDRGNSVWFELEVKDRG